MLPLDCPNTLIRSHRRTRLRSERQQNNTPMCVCAAVANCVHLLLKLRRPGHWRCVCVFLHTRETRKNGRGRIAQGQMSKCVFGSVCKGTREAVWGHAGNPHYHVEVFICEASVRWYVRWAYRLRDVWLFLHASAWPFVHYTVRCNRSGPWKHTRTYEHMLSGVSHELAAYKALRDIRAQFAFILEKHAIMLIKVTLHWN